MLLKKLIYGAKDMIRGRSFIRKRDLKKHFWEKEQFNIWPNLNLFVLSRFEFDENIRYSPNILLVCDNLDIKDIHTHFVKMLKALFQGH